MGLRFDNIPDSAYDRVINKLFGHLNLQNKPDHYECVCPFCGDMRRPNKRKVWIWKDTWKAICYRGCFDQNFLKFLEENSHDDYAELLTYAIDDSDRQERPARVEQKPAGPVPNPALPFKPGELVSLTDMSDPWAKYGREICVSRKIRKEIYESWFACRAGAQFYDRNPDGSIKFYPGTRRPVGNEFKNRIIIPYYRFGGNWGQFDARDMAPKSEMRYLNFKGAARETYNVDFVDFTRRFYILEGALDSTFIRNSIAIGGIKHLGEAMTRNPIIAKHIGNAVLLLDNDESGRLETLSGIGKRFKWFDWDGIASKDINDAVLAGEMPLDSYGFVEQSFIDSRVRDKELADIMMTMRFGDIKKAAFRQKQEARRNAVLNNARAQMERHKISFF